MQGGQPPLEASPTRRARGAALSSGDVGALAIYAGPGRDGTEIEISPAGSRRRVHNVVRRRPAGPVIRYAAIFPALAAGEYTVWRDEAIPPGTVVIHGGQVAGFRLD